MERPTRLRADQLRQIERARALVAAAEGGADALAVLLGFESNAETLYLAALDVAMDRLRGLLVPVDRPGEEWSTSEELCA